MVIMMIIDKVNDIINGHTSKNSLYVFCVFIKENIAKIPRMTIEDIAKACYISKGQVSKCIRNLDYQNYEEFIYECYSYLDSLERRQLFIDKKLSLKENISIFSDNFLKNIQYTQKYLDYTQIEELIKNIKTSRKIYLYAQGDARSLIYNIQRELNIYHINTIICDMDLKKEYSFTNQDLFIVISINGDTFHYDKRIIQRLRKTKVNKWLITCQNDINFCENQIFIHCLHFSYHVYMMRYIIDIILLGLQM